MVKEPLPAYQPNKLPLQGYLALLKVKHIVKMPLSYSSSTKFLIFFGQGVFFFSLVLEAKKK